MDPASDQRFGWPRVGIPWRREIALLVVLLVWLGIRVVAGLVAGLAFSEPSSTHIYSEEQVARGYVFLLQSTFFIFVFVRKGMTRASRITGGIIPLFLSILPFLHLISWAWTVSVLASPGYRSPVGLLPLAAHGWLRGSRRSGADSSIEHGLAVENAAETKG